MSRTDEVDPGDLRLWNELVSMLLEWEDGEGDESAGSLARRIISKVRQREKLRD